MRPLFIGLLLFSSAALAQTTTITLSAQTGTEIVVGAGDCGNQRTVNWARTGIFCEATTLWVTEGSCTNTPDAEDLELGDTIPATPSNNNGTRTFRVGDLPGLQGGGDAGVTCGTQGVTRTYKVCASTRRPAVDNFGQPTGGCSSSDYVTATGLSVTYDAQAPNPPNLTSVVGLDSALNIRVAEAGGDPTEFRVRVTRADTGVEAASRTQSVDQDLFRVDGLENNVTYRVEAFARDEVGNESAASAAQEGTPVRTSGFYQEYLDAGGQETGGCNVAGGGLAGGAMLAALGFWLSSRRNRS
jgi:hypothetical protein